MKNLCGRLTIVVFLAMLATSVIAQQLPGKTKQQLNENYSRMSLTFFMGAPAGGVTVPAPAVEKITFSDKYFNHNLASLVLPIGPEFRTMPFDKKRIYLKELLTREGIGRKMVAKWFNRQPDGSMNLDYVHQCGMYNATDQDVRMSVAAKRGDSFLKDAGQNLINKTYVLILVPNELKSKDDGKTRGWDSQFDFYFYQLLFTPEVVSRFYDVWPYPDDTPEVRQSKAAAFDTLTFRLSDVYSRLFQYASNSESLTYNKNAKTLDQMLVDLATKMYESSAFQLDKNLEDFRVKVKISGTRPPRAKIGKKEGLKCDQQFFVYQYIMDEKTGNVSPERQGVVRATSQIADNRQIATGTSPESSFYQTYGSRLEEGMILQQRLDIGLSVMPGFESGAFGGADINFMFRTGPVSKVTGLYLMIDVGFDSGKYAAFLTEMQKYNFTRYSIGVGKGLHMARIVEIMPFVQYGLEQTKNSTYKEIQTTFVKAGGMLGFNLTHNIALVGQLNYYLPFNAIVKKEKSSTAETAFTKSWDSYFTGRAGSSVMVGLRFEF